MPQQLYASSIRIAKEATTGLRQADGPWRPLPVVAAAVQRDIIASASRVGPNRILQASVVAHQAWSIITSHEATTELTAWLAAAIMTDRDDGTWALDPETPDRSFIIEATAQDGNIQAYAGAKIQEIRLMLDESRLVRVDLTWQALERTEPRAPLAGTNAATFAPGLLPVAQASAAVTDDPWDVDPRATQAVTLHGGQLYISREINPSQYGTDGVPTRYDRAPWRILGEFYMPTESAPTVALQSTWTGRIAIWPGTSAQHLRIDSATGIATDVELKAWDWAVQRLSFEATAGTNRTLLTFHA